MHLSPASALELDMRVESYLKHRTSKGHQIVNMDIESTPRESLDNLLHVGLNHSTWGERNEDQFAVLGGELRPEGWINIWCAGCSYGDEVFHLAEVLESKSIPYYTILGTDISGICVQKAEKEKFEVIKKPERATKIEFKEHNLCLGPIKQNYFDVVICNNVLIHYDRMGRSLIWKSLVDSLRSEGLLLSNTISQEGLDMSCLTRVAVDQVTMYRKNHE